MSFGVPMICTDSREHDPVECYACVNYINGMNRRKSGSLKYNIYSNNIYSIAAAAFKCNCCSNKTNFNRTI